MSCVCTKLQCKFGFLALACSVVAIHESGALKVQCHYWPVVKPNLTKIMFQERIPVRLILYGLGLKWKYENKIVKIYDSILEKRIFLSFMLPQ